MADKNFDYLGGTFQQQLINQIIIDKNFSHSILEVLEANYFENKYYKIIIQMIKEYYKKFDCAPTYDTLHQIIKSEITQELMLKITLDTINDIKNVSEEGALFVQEKALKFCKQQELQKVMGKAQKIIDGGEFENYDTLEEMVREALQVGVIEKDTGDVFENLDQVLQEDYRHPIPMGIPGIDNLLKGGLAKGEIGVILAPTGVGKTSLTTKIANHAFNMGFNVLQIFFEDNPKIIQRKHFTLWTGIAPDLLGDHKEEVMKKVTEVQDKMKNRLILKIKIDVIILDYIDCVTPEKMMDDEWKSEGSVMRAFEAMCHELHIAGWTATQGNRSSISSEVVTTDQMGGSIKKAQVGHVIISVAKTLQQKELKLATIAITKSRIGKDGVIFENCKFDNELLVIDTESSMTMLGFEENKEQKNRDRIREILERKKQQTV